jgi:hypothetical protein
MNNTKIGRAESSLQRPRTGRHAGAIAVLALVVMASGACGGAPKNTVETPGANTSATQIGPFVNATSTSGCPSDACSAILAQVKAGATSDTVPSDLTPSLQDASKDLRRPPDGNCSQLPISGLKSSDQPCTYTTGAPATAPMIVLIGDSQAWMWSTTVFSIAKQLGYGFGLVYHNGCKMPLVKFPTASDGTTDAQCREWKSAAIDWINQEKAAVVLVSSGYHNSKYASAADVSDADMTDGYAAVLKQLQAPDRKLFVLGEIAHLNQDPVSCLAANNSSALKCATPPSVAAPGHETQAALNAAQQTGAGFVNPIPMLCTADICPAVIGNYSAYSGKYHLTSTYAEALAPLVQQALSLSPA